MSQLDINTVLQKLQTKLGEAFTTIAILEAQLEQLQASESTEEAE